VADIRADRESALKMYHDDRMASLEAAKQDRHELRDTIQESIAQVIMEHSNERSLFEKQMQYERENCDKRLDRICVSVEKSQASTDRAIEQITKAIAQLEPVIKAVTKVAGA
jgi:dynactin complex subunit